MCNVVDCDDQSHYGCVLRGKGLQVSPRLQSTRTLNMVPNRVEPPAFNKQLMYDERPGGTKMPILNREGEHMRRKEYGEVRRQLESSIRAQRNTTTTGVTSHG